MMGILTVQLGLLSKLEKTLNGRYGMRDELANETTEILKKKGKSLTVEDFLREREL